MILRNKKDNDLNVLEKNIYGRLIQNQQLIRIRKSTRRRLSEKEDNF